MKSNKGTALLIALLLVVFVEVIVMILVLHHRYAIKTTNEFITSYQGLVIALGGEDWAIGRLIQARKQNELATFYQFPKTPIQGGTVEGIIFDMQDRVNLNNILDPAYIRQSEILFSTVFGEGSQTNMTMVNNLMIAAQSYADPNLITNGYVPFTTITELLQVPGMTSKAFLSLLSSLSALPGITPVNINSAMNTALQSLSTAITPAIAQSIIDYRKQQGEFKSIDDFLSQRALQTGTEPIEIDSQMITVKSNYFLSNIIVKYQTYSFELNSLLNIKDDEDNPNHYIVTVLWRSLNTI